MTDLLQFVIIGVAKCGTTSLHEYLRQNPKISLPKGKRRIFSSMTRNAVVFLNRIMGG